MADAEGLAIVDSERDESSESPLRSRSCYEEWCMKSHCRAGFRPKAVLKIAVLLAATIGLAIAASAQPYTEATIHSFVHAPIGGNPYAAVIQASDGNLYGTTTAGGSGGNGTVFKISNPMTSPTASVIYSFTGGPDGGQPYGSLIQASDGNLYGTAAYGGL